MPGGIDSESTCMSLPRISYGTLRPSGTVWYRPALNSIIPKAFFGALLLVIVARAPALRLR